MVKRLFIVHGWDGNPKETLLQLLKNKFSKEGFEVHIPKMPNSSKPEIKPWISKIKELVKNPDEETYFIGHSVGAQAILRYLETLNNKVGKVIFIAPWMHLDKNTIKEEGEEVIKIAQPWMETPIDWKKIIEIANNFLCVFSDDDPYVPLSERDLFRKELGAKIITEKNMGHFINATGKEKLSKLVNQINL